MNASTPTLEERIPRRPLANGIGLFAIGLGLAQLLAPRSLAHVIGVRPSHPLLLRLVGLREVASGVGILTQRRPAGWLFARIAGDAMDLGLLGAAMRDRKNDPARTGGAFAAVLGVTALDVLNAHQWSRTDASEEERVAIHARRAVIVNRPADELYARWRNFADLPGFMGHLESVRVIDETRSHWVAKAPAGTTVEWDAEITEDRPGESIAWQSLPGAQVPNSGSVQFEPATGGRGTVVRVELRYRPPAGRLGALVAKLFGKDADHELNMSLRRFKQVCEVGFPVTTTGQPAGRAASTSFRYDDLVRG